MVWPGSVIRPSGTPSSINLSVPTYSSASFRRQITQLVNALSSFHAAICNVIPLSVSDAPSISTFKCRLKSFYFHWSTDVWATRCLGDRFLDDHLGDTGWTFRRQQFDVWAAKNICSGKGFSSSESQVDFKDALAFASWCWSVYEPCLNAYRSN